MITKARRNLRRLAVGRFVETSVLEYDEVRVPKNNGVMITNPPYGERMNVNVQELYKGMGDWMKQELKGYSCWIISSSELGFKSVGLKPDKKVRLYNGEIECSFRRYSIFEGFRNQLLNKE
jgi:putative N6-adenine-specific DNA methylase